MNDIHMALRSSERIGPTLAAIVGEEFVTTSNELRKRHSMATVPTSKTCAAVVFPGSAEELQEIVRVAARLNLKIWPFSRGNNWGYGTKNALEENAIIVILERMNRIIEVNEALGYAVVEPGVSQKQLSDHLRQNGFELWADCTDSTPNGSVLGNAIERGYGYTPHGDHFGHLCGLEVVLPTGEMIRTGGEHADAATWNTFKWGSGPYLEGLFSQSNLGIVVKAGVWLMRKPEAFQAFTFEVSRGDDLPHVIDALRELSLERTIQCHTHMVNDFQMLTVLRPYPYERLGGARCLSEAMLSELRKEYGIAPWSLVGGLYGTKDVVAANVRRVRSRLSPYGKLEFVTDAKIAAAKKLVAFRREAERRGGPIASLARGVSRLVSPKHFEITALLPDIVSILEGRPNDRIIASAYVKTRRPLPQRELNPAEDGCGLMWFAPTLPATGTAAKRLLELVRPIYAKQGFDFSGCFTLLNPRTFLLLLGIFYSKDDADETERALMLYHELSAVCRAEGFRDYRLGIHDMERFMADRPAAGQLLMTLKSTLDPANVLAPGRYVRPPDSVISPVQLDP